jgi:hypothetical protein
MIPVADLGDGIIAAAKSLLGVWRVGNYTPVRRAIPLFFWYTYYHIHHMTRERSFARANFGQDGCRICVYQKAN